MYIPVRLTITNITTHANTTFNFREGQPCIIVGENLDDLGQKGNGAGKSGFIEGIAIAIIGSPVRGVSNKEIVRRGHDYGEVELILTNAMFRNEFKIRRRIYSGSKSAQVELYENGEQIVYSDVNEYNKIILTTIGISKEDFFNFFLLTKTTYTPFLAAGDVDKKKIINRFSGADKLDQVVPYIDEDIAPLQAKAKNTEAQVNVNKGKQQLLSEQITTEQLLYTEEAKSAKQASLEAHREKLFTSAESQSDVNQQLDFDLTQAQQTLNGIKQLIEVDQSNSEIAQKQLAAKSIEDEITTTKAKLPLIQLQPTFKARIEKTRQDEINSKKSIEENKASIKEAVQLQADIENQLAGVIECPKCAHKFLIQDKEFSHPEAIARLAEVKELIVDLHSDEKDNEKTTALIQQEKIDINTDILAAQSALKLQIEKLQQDSLVITNQISTLQQNRAKLLAHQQTATIAVTSAQEKLTAGETTFENTLKAIEEVNEQIEKIATSQSEKIDELEERLMTYVDEETELKTKWQIILDELKAKEEWYTNFKNFKSYIANQSIKSIEDYTNLHLQQMGTNLSIKIEGYRTLANKKVKEEISVTVVRDGLEEAPYASFSGGERARVDVAVILAIQSLINLNSPSGGLDLTLIDEVMDSVDELGMQNVIEGLQNVHRTVMIVSQVAINSLQEYTVTIQKKNKISTIL